MLLRCQVDKKVHAVWGVLQSLNDTQHTRNERVANEGVGRSENLAKAFASCEGEPCGVDLSPGHPRWLSGLDVQGSPWITYHGSAIKTLGGVHLRTVTSSSRAGVTCASSPMASRAKGSLLQGSIRNTPLAEQAGACKQEHRHEG